MIPLVSRRRGRSGRSGEVPGCGFQTTSNTWANRRRARAPGPACRNVTRRRRVVAGSAPSRRSNST